MDYFTLRFVLCGFFQMNLLFLAVLCGGLCYASSESRIESLMDHGQSFLPKLVTCFLLLLIIPQRSAIQVTYLPG